jgi:hypothetical protein
LNERKEKKDGLEGNLNKHSKGDSKSKNENKGEEEVEHV